MGKLAFLFTLLLACQPLEDCADQDFTWYKERGKSQAEREDPTKLHLTLMNMNTPWSKQVIVGVHNPSDQPQGAELWCSRDARKFLILQENIPKRKHYILMLQLKVATEYECYLQIPPSLPHPQKLN